MTFKLSAIFYFSGYYKIFRIIVFKIMLKRLTLIGIKKTPKFENLEKKRTFYIIILKSIKGFEWLL